MRDPLRPKRAPSPCEELVGLYPTQGMETNFFDCCSPSFVLLFLLLAGVLFFVAVLYYRPLPFQAFLHNVFFMALAAK